MKKFILDFCTAFFGIVFIVAITIAYVFYTQLIGTAVVLLLILICTALSYACEQQDKLK